MSEGSAQQADYLPYLAIKMLERLNLSITTVLCKGEPSKFEDWAAKSGIWNRKNAGVGDGVEGAGWREM